MVAAVFAALFSLLIPLVLRLSVDSVLDTKPFDLPDFAIVWIENLGGRAYLADNLWICALCVALLALGSSAAHLFRAYCSRHGADGLAKNLRDRLMEHFQNLDFAAFHSLDTGDVIQRCTTDVEMIRNFAAGRIVELARAISVVSVAFCLMLPANRTMMFATMSLIPLVLAGSIIYFFAVERIFLLADEAEGEMSSVLQENVSGVRVVRAFGQQAREVEKFDEKNEYSRVMNLRVSDRMAMFWGMTDAAGYVQCGISLAVGTILCLRDQLTVGELIMFTTYSTMLVWPVRQMGRILADFGKARVAWGRLYDILSRAPEDDGGENTFENGDIVFSHVDFAYDASHPILHDISFTAKQGQTVAILGTTGSGKSTLVSLLARLYDPTGGTITVNGTDLSTINRKSVRQNVGYVLQESFLYSRSLYENLSIACPEASKEAVEQAALDASLTDAIDGFPKGYETMIGERGITLSGGQKQRVAIARTLLRDTPVLVLDDSLSAVDTATDAKIRAALATRTKKQTTFLISHRIGTLMQADLILVLEDGCIAQIGTGEELLAQEGLFRDLFHIQSARMQEVL
ncbi:MAG: ABC transporter ATP-binding protein [Clostridia bacterium]|nr:ABC transporter ATP-binding protein [Clostridia bacterium]